MKKLFFLFTVIFLHAFNTYAGPDAKFEKMWVDYDITQEGQLGMMLHFKFSAYDLKDKNILVAAYFKMNDKEGTALKDKNGLFATSKGYVGAFEDLKPGYDTAYYDDLQKFMPYTELELDPGKYELFMDVKLINEDGTLIKKFTDYTFKFTQPEKTNTTKENTKESKTVSAKFDKIWIDYDATENSNSGMRIHVKFSLNNLKGTDCYVGIYFTRKGGGKLNGLIPEYRTTEGQPAVFKDIKPGFNEAVYDNLELFMPYDALNLGKGKFDLSMSVSVSYNNGTLLKKFTDYDFWVQL